MPALNPETLIAQGPSSIDDKLIENIPLPSPEGDKEVNFDIFDAVKQGDTVTKEQLTIDPKVKEALDKEEAEALKKQETEQKKESEKIEEKKEEEPKPPPTARVPKPSGEVSNVDIDFKDLVPESAVPLLKKASKETQEFIAAELRRNKQALETARAEAETAKKSVKEGIPSSWYEHENAYTLTPEYQASVQRYGTLKAYSDHFRQELIKIKEGEKWVDLVLDATGKIQQVIREPGSEAEVSVLGRINQFETALNKEQESIHRIAGNFKQQVGSFKADMQKAEDEFFPQYKTDFDKNENGKYVKTVLASKGQQNNPLAGFLSKLYAFAMDEIAEKEKLEAELNKGKKIISVNNGPTGGEIDKGDKTEAPKSPEDSPFDPDAFEAVINRSR